MMSDPATPQPADRNREVLSEKEQQFDRWRTAIGLFLGPAVATVLYLAPMPALSTKAHILAAIMGWVVVWWVTEPVPIPVTALLGAVLCVICRVANAKTVFAPFAEPTIFVFLGSFILAKAMAVHGLDKRFAYGIMSLRWVGDSAGRLLLVYGAVAALISMWISNTATTAMMFPVGLGIISAMANIVSEQSGNKVYPSRLRYGTGIMLMAAYAASVGGIGTPVGTPPNLIGIAMIEKFAHVKVAFFQWMLFAVPLLIILYLLLFGLIYVLHRPEVSRIGGTHDHVRREREQLGEWTAGQRNALFAFVVTVILWIVPGFLALACGTSARAFELYNTMVPEAVAALCGAVLLFVLPVNWRERQFTITWQQAVRIDWGTLLLFGGGITLGTLMFETGLAEAIGRSLLSLSGATSLWTITLAAIFMAVLVSEATSNTAAANMVVPVIISLSIAAHVNPVPPAIGATIGASFGLMLPVSTPPNAIVYGSGLVPITRMIRAGVLFDIVGGFVIWLGLRLLLPLVGLA